MACGMVATEVTSPARPRSSASARCTASSISSGERKASGQRSALVLMAPLTQWRTSPSMFQIHHPLDRAPGPGGDRGIDDHLLLEVDEAVENLRQRDALHVRAEV